MHREDQSRPTETSEDTSERRESGSRRLSQNESSGPRDGYRQLGHDADGDDDLDTTELPSEMESQDEQEMSNLPLMQATDSVDDDNEAAATAAVNVIEQSINSNNEPETIALSPANANLVEANIRNVTREEQIASENRELQAAEAVEIGRAHV